MTKLSRVDIERIRAVVSSVPAALRGLLEKNASLTAENEALRKELRSHELLENMDRAAVPGSSHREKIASLMDEDLDAVERALAYQDRASAALFKLANVEPTHGSAGASDPVEAFLLG